MKVRSQVQNGEFTVYKTKDLVVHFVATLPGHRSEETRKLQILILIKFDNLG